jgi:sulfite exporter TauE/SafE
MCGPLAAAACRGQRQKSAAIGSYLGARLSSYAALGGVSGAAGGALAGLSGDVSSFLLAGTVALGLLLTASRIWPREARPASGLVTLGRRPVAKAPRWAPFVMGAITGFLPCGVLLSALMLAAGTGSALGGAASMVAFAIASSPALFAMGGVAAYLDRAAGVAGRRVVAAFLVVGAIVTVMRPFAMRDHGSCHDDHVIGALTEAPGRGGAS